MRRWISTATWTVLGVAMVAGIEAVGLGTTPAAGQTAPSTVPVVTSPPRTSPPTAPTQTSPPRRIPTPTVPGSTVPTPAATTPASTTPPVPAAHVPARAPVTNPRVFTNPTPNPNATTPPASAPVAPVQTVAPLGGPVRSAPSTLPFVTKAQSAHVDPRVAKVSLAGFAVALLLMTVQFVLTRPGRRGRRTL